MIKCYKLRIDTEDESIMEKIEQKYFECFIRGQEVVIDDSLVEVVNPHVHYYIQMFENKTSSLRQCIRKYVGSGNGIYSLKELDSEYPIEYIAYVMKEGKTKIEGIPDSIVEEAKAYDISVKASIKEKQKNKIPMWQRICNDYEYLEKKDAPTIEQVLYDVIAWHKDNDRLIREFQIISITQTILLHISPDFERRYRNRILEKYF